ncbi:MAG TPA: hypothetical protein VGM54_02155 [Chthoniobacter sp.]|jgi:hypothetical protein
MSPARKLALALFYTLAFPLMLGVALVWIFAGFIWTLLRSEH